MAYPPYGVPMTETLPLLPLRRGVLLPGMVTTIPVGRRRSRELVDRAQEGDRIVVAVQYDARVASPAIADLQPIAVEAVVRDKRVRGSDAATVLVEAVRRVQLVGVHPSGPVVRAEVGPAPSERGDTDTARALAETLHELVAEVIVDDGARASLDQATTSSAPGALADRVAAMIDLPPEAKAEILLARDVEVRLRRVLELFQEARTRAELQEKISSEVRRDVSRVQREAMLRQQLKAIRKELGEGDGDGEDEDDRLRRRVDEADLPEDVEAVARRELRRLSGAQGPEAGVIRTYLEWLVDLPWAERAPARQDIDAIAAALDADHHGLDDVKRRILEQMAVLKLSRAKARGTIIALVGPPGVGKTSLAQSVADATGRPLARVSLGGVRDEAEIRGHRRTYVGALPGRIVHALRKAKAKNPVMVLDEIDKLGRGFAGDPGAALLEVLDPEQNHAFADHYLELPFDLSEVLFIATANDLGAVPPALRDRLEIIEVSGYTLDEKVAIGRDHLWPKQLSRHGLSPEAPIDGEALKMVVAEYTREAGVRQLSRELAKVCRALALDTARGQGTASERKEERAEASQAEASPAGAERREALAGSVSEAELLRPPLLDETRLREILGRPRYLEQPAELDRPAGVAAGLAWTPVGGDVLYVETTAMRGKGKIEITGQLGEVMNESARAALAYLRTHAISLGIDDGFLDDHDLHIHVPAGGVPKDGPSAGVTMFTALASLLSGRRVRPDVAMTGEASLRGRVLPVGGIKSKVLAAHRAGFTRIVLPHQNERDLDELPDAVREELDVVLARDMREVLDAALMPAATAEDTAVSSPRTSHATGPGFIAPGEDPQAPAAA